MKAYCKHPTVCVVCGVLHSSKDCKKCKTNSGVKKCSNCGDNHTANYRGCPAYTIEKRFHDSRSKVTHIESQTAQEFSTQHQLPLNVPNFGQNTQSFASVLRGRPSAPNTPKIINQISNYQPKFNVENPQTQPCDQNNNLSRLEKTIDTLVQSITNFTNNMLQEMLSMQSMLLQTLLNKP